MAHAQLSSHLNGISGKLDNFIFRRTPHGNIISNAPPKPEGPPTADQASARRFVGISSRAWTQLSDEQRRAWNQLAPRQGVQDGQTLYNQGSFFRQAAGLPLPAAAPVATPTINLMSVAAAPPTGPDTLNIVFEHPLTDVTGWRIFIQITRDLVSPARQPQPYDFRAVSYQALPRSPPCRPAAPSITSAISAFRLLPVPASGSASSLSRRMDSLPPP